MSDQDVVTPVVPDQTDEINENDEFPHETNESFEEVVEENVQPEKSFVLSRQGICRADANTITVSNTVDGYQSYFRIGGTVGKMTTACANKYHEYLLSRKRNLESA